MSERIKSRQKRNTFVIGTKKTPIQRKAYYRISPMEYPEKKKQDTEMDTYNTRTNKNMLSGRSYEIFRIVGIY